MKCQHCGNFYNNYTILKLLHPTRGIIPAQFCCYKCYLEFWKDNSRFALLKGLVEPAPEPIKKKRVRRTHNDSYRKSAYCF